MSINIANALITTTETALQCSLPIERVEFWDVVLACGVQRGSLTGDQCGRFHLLRGPVVSSSAMATIVPPPSKKQKRETARAVLAASTSLTAANRPQAPAIVVQFSSSKDGSALGPAVRLPSDTDRAGLGALTNQLKKTQKQLQRASRRRGDSDGSDDEDDDDEPTPYSFYVSIPGQEENALVTTDLQDVLKRYEKLISAEDVLTVVCEPEAIFKVRPVARCSSTLNGRQICRSPWHAPC